MLDASISGLSLQLTMMRQMDIIAGNIANASTSGFKSQMLVVANASASASPGKDAKQEIGLARNGSSGALARTDNPLDVAIKGDGYFVVQTPLGERYTRNGRFSFDDQGQLVTADGYAVLGDDGAAIEISPAEIEITISSDGTISTEIGVVATLGVVRFADDQLVRRASGGLFMSDARPLPAEESTVHQGFIEESNVEPILELTKLMTTLRTFQGTQRFLERENDRERRMIQALTRSS